MPTIHERLATLETQQATVSHDVTEIKGDVKTLVAYMVAEQAIKSANRDESQFRRWLAPILLTLTNTVITIAGIVGVIQKPGGN